MTDIATIFNNVSDLLGFHPEESFSIVGVDADDSMVFATRFDLDGVHNEQDYQLFTSEVEQVLTESYATGVYLFGYSTNRLVLLVKLAILGAQLEKLPYPLKGIFFTDGEQIFDFNRPKEGGAPVPWTGKKVLGTRTDAAPGIDVVQGYEELRLIEKASLRYQEMDHYEKVARWEELSANKELTEPEDLAMYAQLLIHTGGVVRFIGELEHNECDKVFTNLLAALKYTLEKERASLLLLVCVVAWHLQRMMYVDEVFTNHIFGKFNLDGDPLFELVNELTKRPLEQETWVKFGVDFMEQVMTTHVEDK